MLRLRELSYPAKEFYSLKEVRLAIDEEIGYTDAAFKRAIKALKRQGWLKRYRRWYFIDMEYSSLSEEVTINNIHHQAFINKIPPRPSQKEIDEVEDPKKLKENQAKRKLRSDDETMDEFMSHL